MRGILCCIREPITDEHENRPQKNEYVRQESSAAADHKKYREHGNSSELNLRKVEWRSLEECFLASPNLNAHPCILGGDQVQMFKNLPTKVHPSSSPGGRAQEFFTPRRSFSAERLGKIDETEEPEEHSAPVTPSSRTGSGKLRKKVSFKLPGEADIFVYYSPKETFEEPSKPQKAADGFYRV